MTLLIALIVAAVVVALIIGCFVIYNKVEYDGSLFNLFHCLWAGVIMLGLLFGTFTKINANEVGIIYDDRYGVLEKTYTEGFQSKSIFEHITRISTTNRNAVIETTGQTNDGQYATFEISIIYRIDSADAGKFYKKTSSQDINTDQLNSLVKNALQSSTIKYDIFELLSDGLETARTDFEVNLRESLMANYFVTLVSATFDDIDAGANIETILQQKAEAEQKIEIARKEAEANLIKAENEVAVAEKQAEVERTLAEAEAFAIKTKGEANAETATAYTTKIMNMISTMQTASNLPYEESANLVLSIVFYDTWDGKLPETLTSDSLSSLIGALITNNSNAS